MNVTYSVGDIVEVRLKAGLHRPRPVATRAKGLGTITVVLLHNRGYVVKFADGRSGAYRKTEIQLTPRPCAKCGGPARAELCTACWDEQQIIDDNRDGYVGSYRRGISAEERRREYHGSSRDDV